VSKSYFTFWSSKVQELESIEDKNIDDDTKQIWLTNSILGQKHLDETVCQSISTELTMSDMANCATTQVSWSNFYHIFLYTVKMLHTSKKVKSANQQQNQGAEQDGTTQHVRGNRGN
jgi:hypothetical protein